MMWIGFLASLGGCSAAIAASRFGRGQEDFLETAIIAGLLFYAACLELRNRRMRANPEEDAS